MYDIPQDDKDCDKNLNDSDGKVESLMITDDTEINANKKSKRQSIDQTKDSQNLEIASDQYGFDSPDEFESKEAIEEKAPENKDHDYDWFINEMQKDVQPVLQKTEQNNDSGSIVTSSTSDSIEPINPSKSDKEGFQPGMGVAREPVIKSGGVDKFINDFKKEAEQISKSTVVNTESRDTIGVKKSEQLTSNSDQFDTTELRHYISSMIDVLAEKIAKNIVLKIDQEKIYEIIKSEFLVNISAKK